MLNGVFLISAFNFLLFFVDLLQQFLLCFLVILVVADFGSEVVIEVPDGLRFDFLQKCVKSEGDGVAFTFNFLIIW